MSKSEKCAIITLGGVQHVVKQGQEVSIKLKQFDQLLEVAPNLIYTAGTDECVIDVSKLKTTKVKLELVEEYRGKKVTAIRYKAKKRVNKTHGHRDQFGKYRVVSVG